MRLFKKLLQIVIIILLFGSLAANYYLYWKNYLNLDPSSSKSYYKIFDKNEILNGDEDSAALVVQKLDKRLAKYRKTFVKMAGTNDEKLLKALFYMNFVHMFGVYGKRELKENTFKDLLWGDEYAHCGTTTLFLAMLLDKADYEFRTVSTNNGSHGFVEIKFDNKWQILDPTINVWIDKNTEELLAGDNRTNKKFFLKAGDQLNEMASENMIRVVNVRDFMIQMGTGYKAKIDNYNYIDLTQYQY